MTRCKHCGKEIERVELPDRASWRDGRGNFRCVGSVHHRPDLPRNLRPDTIRAWLTT